MSKRKKWTKEEARAIAREVTASGLTVAEFARRRSLSYDRVRKCCARVKINATAAPVRMVELVAKPVATSGQLCVHCPSGHRVELVGVDIQAGLLLVLAAIAGV